MSETATDASTPLVVGATLSVQALVSMGIMILPAVAPRAADALGVSSALIGAQVSLTYAFATAGSIFSGRLVRRLGPVRTSQIALASMALGLLFASGASLAAIAIGSAFMGLSYGLPGAAAAHLLFRFTPRERRNLLFSLKQTGVPLGGVLAGLTAPPLANWFDWRAPLLATAVAAAALAVLFTLVRTRWDDDRTPDSAIAASLTEMPRLLARETSLRHLAIIGGLLAGLQLSFMTFLVVLLVEDYGMLIVTAGAVLAAVQVFGVAGRIIWGAMADYLRNGVAVLAGLCLAIGLLSLLVTFSTSPFVVVALAIGLGATAIGWNGVYLAEAARLAPPGQVGEATGALLTVTYLGVCAGPALFAGLSPHLGGYRAGFAIFALAAAVALAYALALRRRHATN